MAQEPYAAMPESRLTHSTDLSNTDPHFFVRGRSREERPHTRERERERRGPHTREREEQGGEEREERRERGEKPPSPEYNRTGRARPRKPHTHRTTHHAIFRHSKKRTRGVHAVPRVLLASSLVVSFFQGPARYKKIVGGG